MQKGLYEYSRARAGHYAKVLFREPEFQAAVEVVALARLSARSRDGGRDGRRGVARACRQSGTRRLKRSATLVLDVFDRYPVPAALGEEEWREQRAELARRLQLVGLHPPKRVIDIPEQWAQTYFDLMPIHEKLRTRDFPTTRNYLRVAMCNIHDEFIERLDVPGRRGVARSCRRARED